MIGILLAGHGYTAEGMLKTVPMFFSNEKQIDAVSVHENTNLDDFKNEVRQKNSELDTGDGVLILTDLLGGSPCTAVISLMNERVDVIAGLNLSMLLSVIAARSSGMSRSQIAAQAVNEAEKGIVNVGKVLKQENDSTYQNR